MKGGYRPEIAPFNKNPPKAGVGFFYGNLGCSALRPAQGALKLPLRKKTPPLSLGTTFSKTENRKIAIAILPYYFLGCCGVSPLRGVAEKP